MANYKQDREESVGSHCVDHFVNLERRRDRQHNPTPSIRLETQYTEHMARSHLRTGSHVSHKQGTWNLRLDIDHLRKKLRQREHVRVDPTPPSSEGSDKDRDRTYRHRSMTPPSESFFVSSHLDRLENQRRRRGESSSPRNLGNDAISKALCQISKSPFARRIDKAKFPHHFTLPTFTIYKGRTNPVEHRSHFNQRMAIHSRNEAFMCKIFPSSLRLVAMRWFNGLEEGSIRSLEELTRAFGARFVMRNRVPRPLNSLLSMVMTKGET